METTGTGQAEPGAKRENEMGKITWSARNNSSFLNGSRDAKTLAGAVRAARQYVREELYGDGKATIFEDGYPVREDERSIHTGFRWEVRKDF